MGDVPDPRRHRSAHRSHTTSFRHPIHSDLLWKHKNTLISLLSNLNIVPRLPCSLLSNLYIVPRLPRDWANHIYISIILRKAIMPYLPQSNCAHQNLKEKPCPELDGGRSRPAPAPLRTQRLTPLAFATPYTPIYYKNAEIRTFPYFQTGTLSHACHVPYFQICTLSHAYHVTGLFKCELPVIMWTHTTSASALYCEKQSCLASPQLSYCELALDYSTTRLSFCELPLDYSTTWLSYWELPLNYSIDKVFIDWATID